MTRSRLVVELGNLCHGTRCPIVASSKTSGGVVRWCTEDYIHSTTEDLTKIFYIVRSVIRDQGARVQVNLLRKIGEEVQKLRDRQDRIFLYTR